MSFLALANGFNIYELVQPTAQTLLFRVLDIFWPLSNVFMLFTGVAVATSGWLAGAKKFVPLIVGLWLPFSSVLVLLFSRNASVLLAINLYSLLAWTWMGWTVYLLGKKKRIIYSGLPAYGVCSGIAAKAFSSSQNQLR
jgi:hypothetical protein